MTTVSAESQKKTSGRARAAGPRLRALVWSLHVIAVAVAVLSVATSHFWIWVDLRLFGSWAVFVKSIWAGATVLVPLCAGPYVAGWFKGPRWIQAGFSPEWAARLLWPTYFMLACLTANTVYFFRLVLDGRADLGIPMPLVAGFVLAAWALLTREWIRRTQAKNSGAAMTAESRCGRATQIRAVLFAALVVAITAGAFLIHSYARPLPPGATADLAVVLGGSLRDDGSASIELTNRVQVAIDLYKHGLVKRILLSGGSQKPLKAGADPRFEVPAMKKVCLDAGIPEEALSLDPVGLNTRATAFNTQQFMRDHNDKSVVACSSDYHLFRTVKFFSDMGIQAYAMPGLSSDWHCANPIHTARELLAIVVYTLDPHYREPVAMTIHLSAPRVVVHKSANTLELFDGTSLIKTYACITGGNPGDKAVEGDRKTPVGEFRMVYKNPESKFHLSLGLDYPNKEDADRGLAAGLITREQYAGIMDALKSDLSLAENQKKLWYTPLGGEIFIHGHANGRTGTAGCVAMSNPDIEELYALLPVNAVIEIRP